MRTTTFAGRVFVIVAALLLLAGCLVTSIVAIRWLSPSDNTANAADTAVCNCPEDEELPNVDEVVNDDKISTGDADIPDGDGVEKICKFVDGYDSNGLVVPSGTTVHGPAAIKPDRDSDHAILLLPGSNYVTSASDEVIWLYIGDSACVLAQGQFFSSTEVK